MSCRQMGLLSVFSSGFQGCADAVCPAGTYLDPMNQEECLPCPEDKPHSDGKGGPCTPCAQGFRLVAAGNHTCVECPDRNLQTVDVQRDPYTCRCPLGTSLQHLLEEEEEKEICAPCQVRICVW